MPYHPLLGNHDNRNLFLETFPEVPRDNHGFLQYLLKTKAGRFLMLDTVEHGSHWGSYCENRCRLLQTQLEASINESVYLFMHHPPFDTGIPVLDKIGLKKGSEALLKIVKCFPNIRHLFFGHLHRPVSGSWHGIPFTTLRGINHQVRFDLKAEDDLLLSTNLLLTAWYYWKNSKPPFTSMII